MELTPENSFIFRFCVITRDLWNIFLPNDRSKLKEVTFVLKLFFYLLQFARHNIKSENSRISRGQFHLLRVNLGSKQKLRWNQEEISYIFTKFQNFLNFRIRDVPLPGLTIEKRLTFSNFYSLFEILFRYKFRPSLFRSHFHSFHRPPKSSIIPPSQKIAISVFT